MSYFRNYQFGDPAIQFGPAALGKFGEPTGIDGVIDTTLHTQMLCNVDITIECTVDASLADTLLISTAELVSVIVSPRWTVRKLDPVTGDIVTSGIQFLYGREDIAQTVETRLKLFLGEYFRDITDGTPWFEQILGKQVSRDTAEAALRNRIAGTPGVVRLTAFSTTYDTERRKMSVSASVLTEYGIAEIEYNG